jgi:hypothetical protein
MHESGANMRWSDQKKKKPLPIFGGRTGAVRKGLVQRVGLARWLGFALWGSVALLTGCLTFPTGSGQTPSPSVQPELPPTVPITLWEPSFSRVVQEDRLVFPLSIPPLSGEGDVSLSFWGSLPARPISDSALFPFPALKEEGEVSMPRSDEDARRAGDGGGTGKPLLRYSHEPHLPAAAREGSGENRSSAPSPGKPSSAPAKEEPARQIPPKEVAKKEVATKPETKPETKQGVSSKEAPPKEELKITSPKPEESPEGVKALPTDPLSLATDPFPPPRKKVEGEVGKTVRIVLPGVGWIYLGEKDRGGKVKYLGKDTSSDATTFSFSIVQEGDTVLQFQQQDLLAKSTTYDSVLLTTSRESAKAGQEKTAGKEGEAVTTGEKALPPGSQPAVLKEGVERNPLEPLPQQVDRWVKEGKKLEAVRLIEGYLQSEEGASSPDRDRWYFTLAQMYEGDPQVKDIKKALYYYEKVRDQFPFSPHWEEADYRSRYIRRNFFEIR